MAGRNGLAAAEVRAILAATARTGGAVEMSAVPMVRWRRLLPATMQWESLIACGTIALAARWLVASAWVGEEVGLVVTGLTFLGLAIALVAATRRAWMAGSSWGAADEEWSERVARLALPTALLLICAGFVRANLVDVSVGMEALVDASGPPSIPATVVLGPGGHDVRLSGELTVGVAVRLEALLDANPQVTRIHLTSEGGLADEGQAVGDLIAAHHLVTFVPDYCVSACTLAFVRGRERLVLDESRLGFHAPYEQGLFGIMYRGDASEQRAAYIAAGVALDFVDAALRVDPADLWTPTQAELLAARVITGLVDHETMPDSRLDGMANLAGARTLVLQDVPELKALAEQRPEAVDAIAAWYLDAYRRERPEGENSEALGVVARGAVMSGLARANDGTLLDLARLLARALDVAGSREVCALIGGEADLVEAADQLKASDAAAVATATGLLARALRGGSDAGSQAATSTAAVDPGTPDLSCAERRRDFAALLAQPEAAADTLRVRLKAGIARLPTALPIVVRPHS